MIGHGIIPASIIQATCTVLKGDDIGSNYFNKMEDPRIFGWQLLKTPKRDWEFILS
jgi:hypothetical protein